MAYPVDPVRINERPAFLSLSKKDLDLMACRAAGLTTVEAAKELGLPFEAVKSRNRRVLRKTGASSMTQAVWMAWAMLEGHRLLK